MRRFTAFLLLAATLLLPAACHKDNVVEEELPDEVRYYANLFAFNVMQSYYLWNEEMDRELSSWHYSDDPFDKVDACRYKQAGKTVDKWTTLMEDYSSFMGSVTGNTKSLGLDFGLYYADSSQEKVCAVVRFPYADSPASKAGLRRGDVILTLDGQEMTASNYVSLVKEYLYGGGSVTLGLADGRSVKLTAVQMYEEPVQTVRTLDADGKKIGYLHFTNFTMDACRKLEEVMGQFKEDGIQELVLDLRYNTGGYTLTSSVLASMLAPLPAVTAGEVFTQDVYNKELSQAFENELLTCFTPEVGIPLTLIDSCTVYPAQVNPGIQKLWVITTDNTASASEALICGLKPYMDVVLVGQRTYGKFCGGFLITAQGFFSSVKADDLDTAEAMEKLEKWGLYVIASRYSDKNGVTLSMPDGIPADYEAKDDPLDGFQLGDPSETMLSAVLALSTGASEAASGAPSKAPALVPAAASALVPAPPVRPAGFGALLGSLRPL